MKQLRLLAFVCAVTAAATVWVLPSSWAATDRCGLMLNHKAVRAARKIARRQAGCLRGIGKSGLPPELSISLCLTQDFGGGVCRAASKDPAQCSAASSSRRNEDQAFGSGLSLVGGAALGVGSRGQEDPEPQSSAATLASVASGLLALNQALFGPSLEVTWAEESSNAATGASQSWSANRNCRLQSQRATSRIVKRRLREFLRCKRQKLRAGSLQTQADLVDCVESIDSDPKGQLLRLQQNLAATVAASCGEESRSDEFPGECAEAVDTAACLGISASCVSCRMIETMDRFSADCDSTDNNVADGSCGAFPLPGVCGNGILDEGEHCDDGNTTGGDCCPPSCLFVPSELPCEEPGCADPCCSGAGTCRSVPACSWSFENVTAVSGIDYEHGFDREGLEGPTLDRAIIGGGVAAGDYDGDGWIDLFAVGGTTGGEHLLRNRGDGTFEDLGAAASEARSAAASSWQAREVSEGSKAPGERRTAETAVLESGPTFADINGDGLLDLLIGGLNGAPFRVLENDGAGGFDDVTVASGIVIDHDTFGAALADYDGDGDLDLALAHWQTLISNSARLWRNDGEDGFVDVTDEAGLRIHRESTIYGPFDWAFTPNFADINGDGAPDLLFSADFGTSQVFLNDGDASFSDATDASIITDENGMGGAIGDYDGDGHLDWFVSSIWDPDGQAEGNWGVTGNRLYRNLGDGTFEDVTAAAGVRRGYWGWGSCFADFDLDGHLDLFHTNGFSTDSATEYFEDPSRLFISSGDGTFVERSAELGLADSGQGRGVVCFDFDNDGDVDLFVANNEGRPALWKNRAEVLGRRFLKVRLMGPDPNSFGVGARITLTDDVGDQVRELQAGSNFESQNPILAHFGLGEERVVQAVEVVWPDGVVQVVTEVVADTSITITHPSLEP